MSTTNFLQKTVLLLILILCSGCVIGNEKANKEVDLVKVLREVFTETCFESLEEGSLYLDTIGYGTNIQRSISALISGTDDPVITNDLVVFSENWKFSNGQGWLKKFNSTNKKQLTIDESEEDLIGVLSVSEPMITAESKLYLYVEVFGGDRCSLGIFVVGQFEKGVWALTDIINVWN